ncbi:MAG: DUF2723 domain-containing protein, partial [bacterium]
MRDLVRKSKKKIDPAAVLLFLACTGICLAHARTFTGWGSSPETALAAHALRPSSIPGNPLYLLIAHLFHFLPFNSVVFGLNVFSSVAAAAALTMLYILLRQYGMQRHFAALPPLLLFTLPQFGETCRGTGDNAFVFLVFVAALGTALWQVDFIRRFPLAVLFFALFVCIHAATAAAGIFLLIFLHPFSRASQKSKMGIAAAGGVVAIAAFSILFFTALRPPLEVNWDSLSAAALQSDISVVAEWTQLLSSSAGIKSLFSDFARAAAGVYIPVFLSIPTVFFIGASSLPLAFIAALLPLLVLLFMISPYRDVNLYLVLIWTLIFILCAGGLHRTCVVASSFRGIVKRLLHIVAYITAVIVFIVPAVFQPSGFFSSAPDHSAKYAEEILTQLPRDTLLFTYSESDPLLNVITFQNIENYRKDVTVLYIEYLTRSGYRNLVKRTAEGRIYFPSEREYQGLMEQMLTYLLGEEAQMTPDLRGRIEENTQLFLHEYLAYKNAMKHPVYFTSVGQFTQSMLFRSVGFVPGNFTFQLKLESPAAFYIPDVLKLKETGLKSDPAAAAVIASFFANLGENFYKNKD